MPNNNFLKPESMAITKRGNNIENLHFGWICILDNKKNIVYKKGDMTDKIFLRSTAKPIQAIPIIDYKINVSLKELAIICGSHSGSSKHLRLLQELIKKDELKLQDLQCGIHFPTDEKEKLRLIKYNLKPNILHNNCSGKHIGMLSVCKKNNWSLENYLKIDHPLQKHILKSIKELSETSNISIAIDGCSAPVFALPILNAAKLFSNFTNPKKTKYSRTITAMTKYPFYMGSENQIDSEIIKASSGKILCKVGAEGVIIAAKDGNSIVMKVSDGSPKIRSIVLLNLLIKFKWLREKDIKSPTIKELLKGQITNHVGNVVGSVEVLI